MMKNMMKTACAIAVLATSANVMAESVDISVKGTIAPVACNASITGGGVIDYGTITPERLKADDFTLLPKKNTNLTIHCDSPAKIALAVANNRQGTIPGREVAKPADLPTEGAKLFGYGTTPTLGLGMANDKPIGGWAATYKRATADDVLSDVLNSNNSGSIWGKYYWFQPSNSNTSLTSVAKKGELVPTAAKVFSYDIEIEAYINKASELDLTKPAALDGSATIEIIYL